MSQIIDKLKVRNELTRMTAEVIKQYYLKIVGINETTVSRKTRPGNDRFFPTPVFIKL
jgi:hypothetical protein